MISCEACKEDDMELICYVVFTYTDVCCFH
jgi:hypothetical protein